jgi:L-seryl-tRNA(Ser) seleniumtransferase
MLRRDGSEITKHAKRLASQLSKCVSGVAVSTIPGFSQMGSGSLPTQNLPTTLVALHPEKLSVEALAKRLRQYSTPVFARIQNKRVLIDPRTLLKGDDRIVVEALLGILGQRN